VQSWRISSVSLGRSSGPLDKDYSWVLLNLGRTCARQLSGVLDAYQAWRHIDATSAMLFVLRTISKVVFPRMGGCGRGSIKHAFALQGTLRLRYCSSFEAHHCRIQAVEADARDGAEVIGVIYHNLLSIAASVVMFTTKFKVDKHATQAQGL